MSTGTSWRLTGKTHLLASLAFVSLAAGQARGQSTCTSSGAQTNHDLDLTADCAAGVCVERVCVDAVNRRATLCGHGFAGTPAISLGGANLLLLSQASPNPLSPCGGIDETLIVSLDETVEGHHKLIVTNNGKSSEPFFVEVGDLAGPQGPAGPTGPQGATGPQGPTGQNGANGADGKNGAAGSTGPAGPQGPAGATGPAGPAGFSNVSTGAAKNGQVLSWDSSQLLYAPKSTSGMSCSSTSDCLSTLTCKKGVCGCVPQSDADFCAANAPPANSCGGMVSAFDNCGVVRTASCGSHIGGPLSGPAAGTFGGQRSFDSQGNLYLFSASALLKIPPGGGAASKVVLASDLNVAGFFGAPLVRPDDSVLVMGAQSFGGNAIIYRYLPDGTGLHPFASTNLSTFIGFGFVQDAGGRIVAHRINALISNDGSSVQSAPWVGDYGVIAPTAYLRTDPFQQITSLCLDGTSSTKYADIPNDSRQPVPGKDGYGLAIDGSGALFFGEGNHNPSNIYRVAPGGGGTATVFTTVPIASTSLVTDPSGGFLYVAGSGNPDTQVFKIDTSTGTTTLYAQ